MNPYIAPARVLVPNTSFVLFSLGTVVTRPNRTEDSLEESATTVLRSCGPVYAGGPGGDFSTAALLDNRGYVVSCHHPDILTIVLAGEMELDTKKSVWQKFVAMFTPEKELDAMEIGLYGRGKRGHDAKVLKIVHVEDVNIGFDTTFQLLS